MKRIEYTNSYYDYEQKKFGTLIIYLFPINNYFKSKKANIL